MAASSLFVGRLDVDALARVEAAPGFHCIVRTPEVVSILRRVLALSGTVTVALEGNHVVGYATDLPFPPADRWPSAIARELGSIEVAAPWRRRGLATRILSALVEGGRLERHVVVAQCLSWHWDPEGARLALTDYGAMLLRLLAGCGFQRFATDESEVAFHPANFLAARIGASTSAAERAAFASALWVTPRTA
jgi:acetoin utilization protein AcuA